MQKILNCHRNNPNHFKTKLYWITNMCKTKKILMDETFSIFLLWTSWVPAEKFSIHFHLCLAMPLTCILYHILAIYLFIYLRIDRNFCLVHEEITSIRLYTPCNPHTQGCVQPDWGYFEWTEQIISIIPYKLIQTFFAMILKNIFIFFKIRQIIGNKFK